MPGSADLGIRAVLREVHDQAETLGESPWRVEDSDMGLLVAQRASVTNEQALAKAKVSELFCASCC